MDVIEGSDCTDTLLDMVYYVTVIRRLSPEMEDILERHLKFCVSCRQKVSFLRQNLEALPVCQNLG